MLTEMGDPERTSFKRPAQRRQNDESPNKKPRHILQVWKMESQGQSSGESDSDSMKAAIAHGFSTSDTTVDVRDSNEASNTSTINLSSDCIESDLEDDNSVTEVSIERLATFSKNVKPEKNDGVVRLLTPDGGNISCFGTEKSCSVHDFGWHPQAEGTCTKIEKMSAPILRSLLPSKHVDCLIISNSDVNCYLALEKMLFHRQKLALSSLKCVILGGNPGDYASKSPRYSLVKSLAKLILWSPETVIYSAYFSVPLNSASRPEFQRIMETIASDISDSAKIGNILSHLQVMLTALSVDNGGTFHTGFIPEYFYDFKEEKYKWSSNKEVVTEDEIPYLAHLKVNDYTMVIPLGNFSCLKNENNECRRNDPTLNADVLPIIVSFNKRKDLTFFSPGDLKTVALGKIWDNCKLKKITFFILSHNSSVKKSYNSITLLRNFLVSFFIMPWTWKFKNPSSVLYNDLKKVFEPILESVEEHPVVMFNSSSRPTSVSTKLGIFSLIDPLSVFINEDAIKIEQKESHKVEQ